MRPGANAGPREVAESYWRAECERDVEAVLEHFHTDAVFSAPGRQLLGRSQIRTYYDASCADYPGLDVKILSAVVAGEDGAFEWLAILTDNAGVVSRLRGVNLVRVEAGKFRHVHCFFDPAGLSAVA